MDTNRAGPEPAEARPGAAEARLEAAKAAARREAEERRRQRERPALPPEIDGRGGEEPTRYGDWEVKGLASDF